VAGSSIAIRVSTIVSYRTDGTIFDDERGEEPDVRIDPLPGFFIGSSDRVLDAAVERLRDEREGRRSTGRAQ